MMWVKNKITGLTWEVTAQRAAELIASGSYEAASVEVGGGAQPEKKRGRK